MIESIYVEVYPHEEGDDIDEVLGLETQEWSAYVDPSYDEDTYGKANPNAMIVRVERLEDGIQYFINAEEAVAIVQFLTKVFGIK